MDACQRGAGEHNRREHRHHTRFTDGLAKLARQVLVAACLAHFVARHRSKQRAVVGRAEQSHAHTDDHQLGHEPVRVHAQRDQRQGQQADALQQQPKRGNRPRANPVRPATAERLRDRDRKRGGDEHEAGLAHV